MFTGIVEDVGEIVGRSGDRIRVDSGLEDRIGASIAVNGACLTLLGSDNGALVFETSEETLSRTNLKESRYVNLERSLSLGSRMGGHMVLGHVDCVADVLSMGDKIIEIGLPGRYARYVIEKGSIAVDGISLTIADVKSGSFSVAVLPYTTSSTNLRYGQKRVNLEFDYTVKAIESVMSRKVEEEGWKEIIGVM
jgi:riboflavin synthase